MKYKNNRKNPKVSIVIRTKNEEQWIEQCLIKIKKQTYSNFEIIIVDNKSKDSTLNKISKFKVKLIKINKFFPGDALNKGIKKSSGEIIVCLSAHCIPENNDWLLKLVQNFRDKNVAGVYGRQLPLAYSSDFDKRDLYTFFGLEKRVQRKDTFFHNANSAIRKTLWKKIPFDENVEHIEDRIWAHKVINKGYKLIYEPEAAVFHWHGINQNMDEKRCSEIVSILENLDNIYRPRISTNLKNMNTIAIVPQRNISLTHNNKNYLITKTIQDLKKSKYISDVYIATDNKNTKNISSKNGAKVPFLRPKNLSLDYIDIGTIAKYYLKKLEKNKIFADYIVLATENFPFRDYKIFDKMLEQIHKENSDIVYAVKEEKGTIFREINKKISKINDGLIPKKIRDIKNLSSRIGLSLIAKANIIRSGNFNTKNICIHNVKDQFSFIEVNRSNIKNARIKNQLSKIF